MRSFSDEDLMVLYQDGNYEAFQLLYARHSSRVLGYLRRKVDSQSASELLQDVFLKVHRARGHYSGQYPFLPWLFTIARSVFLDHVKRAENKLIRATSGVSAEILESGATGEIELDLTLAVADLPENQRRSIERRYLDDWSFEQIAAELKTSPANVRQLISRGLARLRLTFSGGGK